MGRLVDGRKEEAALVTILAGTLVGDPDSVTCVLFVLFVFCRSLSNFRHHTNIILVCKSFSHCKR